MLKQRAFILMQPPKHPQSPDAENYAHRATYAKQHMYTYIYNMYISIFHACRLMGKRPCTITNQRSPPKSAHLRNKQQLAIFRIFPQAPAEGN